MPGLNQLKKFSADILQMGNEPERRRIKGESPIRVSFPENASEADDSGQFVLGLPQEGDFTSESAGSTSSEDGADEEIDIDALLANALAEQGANNVADLSEDIPASESVPEEAPASDDFPSLDDNLFGDISNSGISDGSLDALADFEADTSDLFTDPAIDDLTAPEPAAETPASEPSDFDFAAAVADTAASVADTAAAGFEDFTFGAEDAATASEAGEAGGLDALEDFDLPEEPAPSSINDEFAITGDTEFLDMNDDLPESLREGPDIEEDPFAGMGELDFSSAPEEETAEEATPVDEPVPEADGFELDSVPDISSSDSNDIADFAPIGFDDDSGAAAPDFDVPSFDTPAGDVAELGDLTDVPDISDFELDSPVEATSFDAPASSDGTDDFSMPDFDLGGDGLGSSENFDLPPVDGLDAIDMGDIGGSSGDDFSIPGFSDFDMIPPGETPAKPEAKTAKSQKDEPPPLKTELTDYEYNIFLENLDYYPLNVRLALQDMIVKNEFTDDAVMDVIHKVIKKIPARQLAAHLEKLLDISLPVPANYEKRTAAEYEAYKQSLAYQLRNKIIPIAIASVFSLLVCTLFGWLITRFVVIPVKAEQLYMEGYELISNEMYPQSEQKFKEAVAYKAKRKWYFAYARAYRDAHQYDRAAVFYNGLMKDFDGMYDQDLTAGLEYANMELYDLSNYAEAERIVRREILDYHLDDPQGMLLLGDVYLEWATNTSSEEKVIENGEEKSVKEQKFEQARYAYEDLMFVHGQTDQYLSRMLRYYIRTDKIPKVLELKSYFYPKLKKNATKVMENKDQVELAGYMLDKLYGNLSPQNEYLRAYVEDVRELLEIAITSCEKTKDMDAYPEAVYNFARYFVETSNPDEAERVLLGNKEKGIPGAIDLLADAEKKSHARTLRQINAYRLLGEIYTSDLKYIDAEKAYSDGVTVFEYERQYNNLEPDENVGLLYADLADIDYFLSGDYNAALLNYQNAIDNKNETASIRYRVGWIQYVNGNYSEALGSFIWVVTNKPSEKNALLALGNTLARRNSTAAAAGYYDKLLDELELEIQRADVSLNRVQDIDQEDLFTLYMRATNNLGVALAQDARQTSDSNKNARAIAQFANSIQAYDALHRNAETYVRLPGSNLAEMNLKYLTASDSSFEPEYYFDIPRILEDEIMLKQVDE